MSLKEKLENISRINSEQSSLSDVEQIDEEEKAGIELQIGNLQTAILVSEIIRDKKMLADEDLLLDFSNRRSLRLKY